MSPDINSPVHHCLIIFACVLPFIGFLSGNPTAMVITMIIGGLIAIPYFAVLAQAEHKEREEKQ